MRAIINRIEHFLVTNTLWLFLTAIAFVSFIRTLTLRQSITGQGMIYLEIEKWQLFGQFILGHTLLFFPVLLFSYFRNRLRKLLPKLSYWGLWCYCFIAHGFLLFYFNVAHFFEPLQIQTDTPVIFGLAILVIELLIQFLSLIHI